MRFSLSKQRDIQLYLITFITCVALFLGLMVMLKVVPFGNKTILTQDLNIQYVDYFAYWHKVLHGKASIGYSFNKSLGGSLVAWWGYYMASPLNVLVYFVEPVNLPYFIMGLITCKIGLIGASMAYYLRHRYPTLAESGLLALSLSFAFCHYNITQMPNVMWLDGVILLPLMALGTYHFVIKKGFGLLYFSLVLAIFCNWYTAYMNCLFVGLYFCYEYVIQQTHFKWRKFLRRLGQFSLWCILAVMGAAFSFIPVLLGLLQGKGAGGLSPLFDFATNGQFLDILRGFMLGYQGERSISLFSGSLVLCLCVVYFCMEGHARTKWLSLGMLAFLIASLYLKPLEHIWNDFRPVHSYWYRFAYVVHFMLVVVAARVLIKQSIWQALKAYPVTIGLIVICLLLYGVRPFNPKHLALSIAILLLLTYLTYSSYRHRVKLMGLILCVELLLYAYSAMHYRFQVPLDQYQTYVRQQEQLVERIKEAGSSKFYRSEQTTNREASKNGISAHYAETMAYTYPGISHYSSTFDGQLAKWLNKLGYSDLAFITTYNEPILPSDSLLGVKYVSSPKPLAGFKQLDWGVYNDKQIYENPYALDLGLLIPKTTPNQIKVTHDNPFLYQNQLYSALLGREVDLFEPVSFDVIHEGKQLKVDIAQENESSLLYGYGRFTEASQPIQVYLDGAYKTDYQTWLSYLVMSFGQTNQAHQISFEQLEQDQVVSELTFYHLKLEPFAEAIKQLKKASLQLKTIQDGLVQFDITSRGDQDLLLTVPYDKGWQAEIDGERVAVQAFEDTLIRLPLKQGQQLVTLTYQIPGMRIGLGLSGLAWFIFILSFWLSLRASRGPHIGPIK